MKKLMMLTMTLLVALLVEAGVVPEQRLVPEWRAERHAEKVAQAKTGKAQWVMIGDSITHNWERQRHYAEAFDSYDTLNLGVGGARTETVLWRLQNGELEGVAPKLVTLMIGTNNSKRNTPEEIFAGIQAVVGEVRTRLPKAKVVVFSIFPRKPGKENDTVQAVNALLPQIADGERVRHVDINEVFLDAGGKQRTELYSRDLLHLSDKGYEVWRDALQPLLVETGLKNPEPAATCSQRRRL